MKANSLLEGFLKEGAGNEFNRQKIQLIRILSRTATLPKVSDLHVQFIHSQPEMFVIEPGKQLRIGVRLIEQPILALVALHYGIEWHIWYKAFQGVDGDSRIPDLAAAITTSKFIDLLPSGDREHLETGFPDDLSEFYNIFRDSGKRLSDYSNEDLAFISKFHGITPPGHSIDARWIELIEQLAIPTEKLLMSGGDVRMNIDPNSLLNVYGCRPFPRPEAFTFASSTATSVSNIAFDETQNQRIALIRDSVKNGLNSAYRSLQNTLQLGIRKALNIQEKNDIILAPSGTDISLMFAGLCQSAYSKHIKHILVASDETGSGVGMALQGHHFANTTAFNVPSEKDTLIEGFRRVRVDQIPLRDESGLLKDTVSLENEIHALISSAMSEGEQAILHVMDQSKLGYASPSFEFVQSAMEEFGEDLLVMVDNSQLRMDNRRLNAYLNQGCLITLTGSKFFTGPPFCGALILPSEFSKILEKGKDLPVGFKDYFPKNEFLNFQSVTTTLMSRFNFGSYLRWTAAVTEMERYYQIPISLRELGTELFCEYVSKIIENSEFLESLESRLKIKNKPLAVEARTIFPFFIHNKGNVLTHPEATLLYRLLNKDISSLLEHASESELRTAKLVCHIGQPVKVKHENVESAVLRISLGSRVLAESWKDRDVSLFFHGVENQMNQVNMICQKIKLILKYRDVLQLNKMK